MKINMQTDSNLKELEITINCPKLTPEIEKILELLRMLDQQLTGIKNNETFLIDIANVFYIETVDKKTFLYTEKGVFESKLKLYELEDKLEDSTFLRIGKSTILNLRKIQSLRADINRRIRVTMENQEQIIVSRQYAEILKKKLGVK